MPASGSEPAPSLRRCAPAVPYVSHSGLDGVGTGSSVELEPAYGATPRPSPGPPPRPSVPWGSARLASDLTALRAEVARDDSVLAAFVGPEVHVVSLTVANAKPASDPPMYMPLIPSSSILNPVLRRGLSSNRSPR